MFVYTLSMHCLIPHIEVCGLVPHHPRHSEGTAIVIVDAAIVRSTHFI